MALEVANVEQMMAWFAAGGRVRPEFAEAGLLVEKLAELVFEREFDWPDRTGQITEYRDRLRDWLAEDGTLQAEFVSLTSTDADPGVFVSWLARTVADRESRGPDAQEDDGSDDCLNGFRNPNWDGTPGTEYYRHDESTGQYLYAAHELGPDWESYEQRRYSEASWNDDYSLNCRYDRREGVYEWLDEKDGSWNDQLWADEHYAVGPGADDDADAADGASDNASGPAWDAGWRMFYRLRPDGVYEYAHATIPGLESSGCGGTWMTRDQAEQARGSGDAEPGTAMDEHIASLHNDLLTAAGAVLPQLSTELSDEDIKAVFAEVAREVIQGAV